MSKYRTSVTWTTHEGQPVKVVRRHRRSFEVALLYKQRAANRREDEAREVFTSTGDRTLLDRHLIEWNKAVEDVQRLRAVRRCYSRLNTRNARRRLSLLELRHGVDAYAVRDALDLAHQLSATEPGAVDRVLTVTPVEEGRVCSRPPDEFTVDEVGANAPPVGVCRKSTNTRRPPR